MIVDQRMQRQWQPILVIDTQAQDKSRLFIKEGLPKQAVLFKALSEIVESCGGKLRVRHYVCRNRDKEYGPSHTMAEFARFYACGKDGHQPHHLYFKEITSKNRIKETLKLIRRGIVIKAVFEIENYDLGVVFHLNTQRAHVQGKAFDLFDCDLSIHGDVEVRFNYWTFMEKRKLPALKDRDYCWAVHQLDNSDGEMIKTGIPTSRKTAISRAIKIFMSRRAVCGGMRVEYLDRISEFIK